MAQKKGGISADLKPGVKPPTEPPPRPRDVKSMETRSVEEPSLDLALAVFEDPSSGVTTRGRLASAIRAAVHDAEMRGR